jgi:predicted Zn-dependent protease
MAVMAAGDRRFDVARAAFCECIAVCRNENDNSHLGLLLQMLGDMEAEAGDAEAFTRCHTQALALDPQSPLPRLFYARSLLRHLKDPCAASAEVFSAEALLAASNFPCDDELPFAYYEREIATLRADITAAQSTKP